MQNKIKSGILICLVTLIANSTILKAQSQKISYLLTKTVDRELIGAGYDTSNVSKIKELVYDTLENFKNAILCDDALIFLAQQGDQSIRPIAVYRFNKYLLSKNYIRAYNVFAALAALMGDQGHDYAVELLDSIVARSSSAEYWMYVKLLPNVIAALMDYGDYSRFDLFKGLFRGKTPASEYDIGYYYYFYSYDPIRYKAAYDSVKSILLNNEDSEYRYWACRTLGRMGHTSEVMTIFNQICANDPSGKVRYWAIKEMEIGGDTIAAINAYGALLTSQIDVPSCQMASFDLWSFGTPEAFSMLYQSSKALTNRKLLDYTNDLLTPCFPYIDTTTQLELNYFETVVRRCGALNWITNQQSIDQLDELIKEIQTSFAANDMIHCVLKLEQFVSLLYIDSSYISEVGRKFLYSDAQDLLYHFPSICVIKLINSSGSPLLNGSLQYYEGSSWKDASNNNNGNFIVNTLVRKKVNLRMTYAYGTQTKSNVPIGSDTIIFRTKNVAVNLQKSQGNPLDTGIVQYNSSTGWQNFGTTSNGVVTNELLPVKYTFRMTYNGATISKSQSIDSTVTVIFHTIPTIVQLQTSTGIPLDTGLVQYNAGGWKSFGTTTNGIATKELLPTNYNFRMTYDGATVSQAQSIDSSATVIFQTVKTLVQFNNSKGNPIDTGVVQFNSGGWQNYGNTSNGVVSKELLPVKYTFRLTYCGSTVNTAQNVDSNATVVFSTVLCTVNVTNSSGSLLNNATVSYNAVGWKVIGTTTNGIVTIELLPAKIQFRAAYGSKQQSVTQDVSINPFIPITLPVQ